MPARDPSLEKGPHRCSHVKVASSITGGTCLFRVLGDWMDAFNTHIDPFIMANRVLPSFVPLQTLEAIMWHSLIEISFSSLGLLAQMETERQKLQVAESKS